MSKTGTAVKVVGIAAGVAGAAVAAGKLAVRRERRRPDAQAGSPFEPPFDREHIVHTFDGGTLFVIDRGAGPPIVLCHGVTLSVRTWVHQMQDLPARGVRAVAFDSRGHGRSEIGSAGHAVEHLAADLRALLEALDLRDAVLVGHSMGGVAVQAFALEHPDVLHERVAGLVLLSTLSRAPLGRFDTLRLFGERSARTTDRVTDRLFAGRDSGYLAARLAFGRQPSPSHVELTREMVAACAPDTRLGAPMALLGLNLTERLAGIDVPTLVLCGTADLLTPPAESRRIARHIPGAELELVPGGGHMLMLERSDFVTDRLATFAREVGARSSAAAGA